MVVLETKTLYAFEHHIFNPQDAPYHLCLFEVSSRDLRGEDLHLLATFCLPCAMLSALHMLSHFAISQSWELCPPAPIYRQGDSGSERRFNHLPRAHRFQGTAVCIIHTQPIV